LHQGCWKIAEQIGKRNDRLHAVQENIDKLNEELAEIQLSLDGSHVRLDGLLLDQKRLAAQCSRESKDAKAAAKREQKPGG
jgi:uncharacterized coiled-coil DUF342 family protein